MQRPGRRSEEQKYEVIRSILGNALINLKVLIGSETCTVDGASQCREVLVKAASVVQDDLKRAKEKGKVK
ncbi:MAG: hypothetical protein QXO30_06890 [Candidatus Caldarchaeum sp.]